MFCNRATSPPPSARRERGFTLVELISVIVILAALAVNAIPRFVDLSNEAHRAAVAATAGALQVAVQLANAGCIIRNFAGRDNLPIFGAGDVDFNANCLPSSTNGNNGNVNGNRCRQIWIGVLSQAPSISTPANDSTDYRAQGGGTTCRYTYRRDSSALRRINYSTTTGLITVINP